MTNSILLVFDTSDACTQRYTDLSEWQFYFIANSGWGSTKISIGHHVLINHIHKMLPGIKV